MATYFGEILEPGTRAISADQYEDEEELAQSINLTLKWKDEKFSDKTTFDTIYILCGKLVLGFADSFLIENIDNSDGIIEVTRNSEPKDGETRNNLKPCLLFVIGKSLYCFISQNIETTETHKFVKTIQSLLKNSKQIIVLVSDLISSFKTEEPQVALPSAFLYSLKTSSYVDKLYSDWLPVPNFLTGVPAAVVSYCQIHKLPAVTYICYTDEDWLDSITAAPLIELSNKLNIRLLNNGQEIRKKKLYYGQIQSLEQRSNMYL